MFGITEKEFKKLMSLQKCFLTDPSLPSDNDKKIYAVQSIDGKENFSVHVERKNTIEIRKSKLQNGYQKIPLVRVEFDCPPHRNPDGSQVGRNHIHIYREGYGLSWALDLDGFDPNYFKDPSNYLSLFDDFCKYCKIDINAGNPYSSIQGVMYDVFERGFQE